MGKQSALKKCEGPQESSHDKKQPQSTRRITSFTFATNPTREQTAASEQIEVQIKEAIEQKYNIVIDGYWSKEQLSVLKEALQNLPDNFALAHPGKQTVFITGSIWADNAYCLCFTLTNNPRESDNCKINLGTKLLRNQKVVNIMAVHELTHARSLIILIASGEKDEEYVLVLWYQDEIERIVGMPFSKFALITKIKLKLQYPELYVLSQQGQTMTQERPRNRKISKSFIEQVSELEWRSSNKVDRWRYAIGASSHPLNKKYPAEFLAVLAEWYIQGKDVFMYNMEGVISKEVAEALHEFLRVQIFDGVEYTQDGKAIKPPKRPEVTPLRRGRY